MRNRAVKMLLTNCSLLSILVLAVWLTGQCRSDTVEGSRILEELFRDYDRRIRPNFGGTAVVVNVSMHILSISEIDTASMTFTLSFYIRQMWSDSRLYFNSRRNVETITLDASTSERIWTPDTFFVNELSSVDHSTLVKNQFCRISQHGSVLLSRRVTLTAFSPMSSAKFPYDAHNLSVDLESYGSQSKDLKYQWSSEPISWFNEQSIPDFFAEGFTVRDSLIEISTGSYSRLSVDASVRRDPLPYELGVMLPTCLVALLCLSSTWAKTPGLGYRCSVLLVSLLAVVYGMSSMSRGNGNPLCMTPLQIYVALASAFGCVCVISNLRKEQLGELSNKSHDPEMLHTESKSRTESTSDSSQEPDHDRVVASFDARNRNGKSDSKWSRLKQSLRKGCGCKCSLEKALQYILWSLFLAWNLTFFANFRYMYHT